MGGQPGACQGGVKDGRCLRAELVEGAVAVDSHAKVDLGDRGDADALDDIDEETDVDAVALDERDLLEELAATRILAGERLGEHRQLREEEGDQRTGDQLGDPPALAAHPVERPLVEPLAELDVVLQQQRSEQPCDEARPEVAHVGVAPHDDVAVGDEQRLPHGVALARARTQLGGDVGCRHHSRSSRGSTCRRAVSGPVVDDDDLVNQGLLAHEVATDGRDDGADRRRLVPSRQAHRDAAVALGLDQAVDRELAVIEGADCGGGHAEPKARHTAPSERESTEARFENLCDGWFHGGQSSRAAEGRAR